MIDVMGTMDLPVEPIVMLTGLGLALGVLLTIAARTLKVEGNPLATEIEQMLPGTQCGQCGYPGCTPAAEALARGEATVGMCPPGGRTLAAELAEKLGIEINLSDIAEKQPMVAFVNEDLCIGCCRCFQQCPVDAMLGAPKQKHTVIAGFCDGCGKCVKDCPTECVEMRPIEPTVQTWYWPKPTLKPLKRAA